MAAIFFAIAFGYSLSETQTGEGAYRGRGASAFGALSPTVFTPERDPKRGPGYTVLNCVKTKGKPFELVLLKLNQATRWFEVCDEKPEARPGMPTAQEIADFVADQGEARTADIQAHFAGRGSPRPISDRIALADRRGLITKDNHKAPWRSCNAEKGHSEPFPQVAAGLVDTAFMQDANPIGDCMNAQTEPNGHASDGFACCSGCGAAGLLHTYCDRCGEFLR